MQDQSDLCFTFIMRIPRFTLPDETRGNPFGTPNGSHPHNSGSMTSLPLPLNRPNQDLFDQFPLPVRFDIIIS